LFIHNSILLPKKHQRNIFLNILFAKYLNLYLIYSTQSKIERGKIKMPGKKPKGKLASKKRKNKKLRRQSEAAKNKRNRRKWK